MLRYRTLAITTAIATAIVVIAIMFSIRGGSDLVAEPKPEVADQTYLVAQTQPNKPPEAPPTNDDPGGDHSDSNDNDDDAIDYVPDEPNQPADEEEDEEEAPGGGYTEGGQMELTEDQLKQRAVNTFKDIKKDAYYAAAVGWLLPQNIIDGCEEDMFCPNETVSRSEMALFLWRLAGSPPASSDGGHFFDDVEAYSSANEAIGWLAGAGITKGCDFRKFCPAAKTTRDQVASFIYRYKGSPDIGDAISRFTDVDSSSPHYVAVVWLEKTKITKGCKSEGSQLFCPSRAVTRAQLATFFYRTHLNT